MKNERKSITKCLIALGSNLASTAGGVGNTIIVALELLDREPLEILQKSRLFSTPAFPAGSGPDFVNAAIEVQTELSPDALLTRLHAIEAEMGRTRTARWEARILDIDLISFGAVIAPDTVTLERWMTLPLKAQIKDAPEQLVLPHPRMHERSFVLVPLMDIAPDWVHPALGLSVREMVQTLDPQDVADVRVLES